MQDDCLGSTARNGRAVPASDAVSLHSRGTHDFSLAECRIGSGEQRSEEHRRFWTSQRRAFFDAVVANLWIDTRSTPALRLFWTALPNSR
jgi:hypothetical protein